MCSHRHLSAVKELRALEGAAPSRLVAGCVKELEREGEPPRPLQTDIDGLAIRSGLDEARPPQMVPGGQMFRARRQTQTKNIYSRGQCSSCSVINRE